MSTEVVSKYHCNNYGKEMSTREGVESPISSGELPSAPTGSMAYEELEYKYNKLRKDNHQLQLRILGVNELARLLQDRNEVVAMLKEKNKRLDVSVVRLENRCANFERQIKSQKSNGVASAKPGQSPFIPGPSKQILQSLWQENEDLKKTVNNLQKKGSSGYLEAIKTTQLEEFIDEQKHQIEQLHKQIEDLASQEGGATPPSEVPTGSVSLQANVTDSGPLRKKIIKMEQTMMVKDRFSALLSQQVTELQKKVNGLQSAQEFEDSRQENQALTDKMSELQVEVKHLNDCKSALEEKCSDITQLYSATYEDLKQAQDKIEELTREKTGTDGPGENSGGGNSQLNNEVRSLTIQLDEMSTKLGEALSKESALVKQVDTLELQVRQLKGSNDKLERQILSKNCELNVRNEQIKKLERQLDDIQEDLSTTRTYHQSEYNKQHTFGGGVNVAGLKIASGGAPSALTGVSQGQDAMHKDGSMNFMSELIGRDGPKASNPVTTAATGMPTGGMMQGGRGNMSGVGSHPKLPPNALHLSGAGTVGGRPRSPITTQYSRATVGHTPHPTTAASIHTPGTPLVPLGMPMSRTTYTVPSPAPMGSQQQPSFGTPGMGVQSAFGPGMPPSSRVVPSNMPGYNPRQTMPYGAGNPPPGNYTPVGYRVSGPMGGQSTGRYTPTSRSVTAPVYGHTSRPMMETSYPGGQGGQGGHQAAPAIHYPSSSWSGDSREHTTSGATSPHHHDNPPHYGGSYSTNPKYR